MPFDLLPRSSDRRPGGDHIVSAAEFDLDPAPVWPEEDARPEPILLGGPQWIEFAEADRLSAEPAHRSLEAALLVGFDEPDDGAGLDRLQQRTEEPPPLPAHRAPAIGMLGALGMHVLALLALLGWGAAPGEVAAPIPVRLVIEQPPPAPKPPPPASTHLASDEMGDGTKNSELVAPPHPAPPPRPPELRMAAMAPPPKPRPPAKQATAPVAPRPHPAPPAPPHAGRIPGPNASRDEYLAYLVALTRQHVNLLPISVIGDRRGETALSLLVLGDGTIARIAIAQSSGYHDIDARIEQIVAAVHRFPPLPERFPGPDLELKLRFRFPDAVLGR